MCCAPAPAPTESDALSNALTKVESIATHINESKRTIEAMNVLVELHARIHMPPPYVVEPASSSSLAPATATDKQVERAPAGGAGPSGHHQTPSSGGSGMGMGTGIEFELVKPVRMLLSEQRMAQTHNGEILNFFCTSFILLLLFACSCCSVELCLLFASC